MQVSYYHNIYGNTVGEGDRIFNIEYVETPTRDKLEKYLETKGFVSDGGTEKYLKGNHHYCRCRPLRVIKIT